MTVSEGRKIVARKDVEVIEKARAIVARAEAKERRLWDKYWKKMLIWQRRSAGIPRWDFHDDFVKWTEKVRVVNRDIVAARPVLY